MTYELLKARRICSTATVEQRDLTADETAEIARLRAAARKPRHQSNEERTAELWQVANEAVEAAVEHAHDPDGSDFAFFRYAANTAFEELGSELRIAADGLNAAEVYEELHKPAPRVAGPHTIEVGKTYKETRVMTTDLQGIELYKRYSDSGAELEPIKVFSRGASMAAHCRTASGCKPEELSIGRLIRARILGSWRGAQAEAEELRAMSTELNTQGGFLVPDSIMSNVIDYARNRSVLFTAGAKAFDMNAQSVVLARGTSDPTMAIKSENDKWTAVNSTFDALRFTAKTIGAVIEVSRELIQDASNVSELISNQLAAAFATSIDASCLNGDGSNDLLGVMQLPDTQTEALSANLTFDAIIDAMADIENYNGTANAFMTTPTTTAYLRKLKTGDGTNSAAQYLAPPPDVAKLQWLSSKQVTSQECYVGDFRTCLIGFRLRPEIQISEHADEAFERNQIKIRLVARVDCNAEHPEWLKRYTALTT